MYTKEISLSLSNTRITHDSRTHSSFEKNYRRNIRARWWFSVCIRFTFGDYILFYAFIQQQQQKDEMVKSTPNVNADTLLYNVWYDWHNEVSLSLWQQQQHTHTHKKRIFFILFQYQIFVWSTFVFSASYFNRIRRCLLTIIILCVCILCMCCR